MVMVVAGAVFAQTATMPVASKDELVTLTGDVIDNMCAGSQTPESLASFVKTHTKECAIAPSCLASGYSIFADGRLWKFDKASSDKVGIFLRAADSKLQVVVDAKKTGEVLTLVAIRNQE
jgi:hypothetical protein